MKNLPAIDDPRRDSNSKGVSTFKLGCEIPGPRRAWANQTIVVDKRRCGLEESGRGLFGAGAGCKPEHNDRAGVANRSSLVGPGEASDRKLPAHKSSQPRFVALGGLLHSAPERLARPLIECTANNPEKLEPKVKLALTDEEIVQIIGTSRKTVTRVLADFPRRQIAVLKGSTLTICNNVVLENRWGRIFGSQEKRGDVLRSSHRFFAPFLRQTA